jgi:hypothetical protein
MALEIPLEPQRVESSAICGICRLKSEQDRNRVNCVLETATQKTWEVWAREDPSVAQTGIKDSSVAAATTYGMSPACPDLDLVSTLFGSGLRHNKRRGGQEQQR